MNATTPSIDLPIGERLTLLTTRLRNFRATRVAEERHVHMMIADELRSADIPFVLEHKLPGRTGRVDVLALRVVIEIKIRRPHALKTLGQVARYAVCDEVDAVILVVERTIPLPEEVVGKPLRQVALHDAWGVAL